MRGLGRLGAAKPGLPGAATGRQALAATSHFSTFSPGGGGGGRGRGRGSDGRTAYPSRSTDDSSPAGPDEPPPSIPGLGHGRGKPIPSSPILPSFSSWMSGAGGPGAGRGRGGFPEAGAGRGRDEPADSKHLPKKPIFFTRDDRPGPFDSPPPGRGPGPVLPSRLATGLPGTGRGKTVKPEASEPRAPEENRHLRRGPVPGASRSGTARLSREDAVKKAVGILGRGRGEGRGRGRGFRGRGGGRMFVRDGRDRGRGRGFKDEDKDEDDDFGAGLYMDDNADEERLEKRLGKENMNKLIEGFEELSWNVLPSPMDDVYLDAVHTNNMIEYEPEYLVDFDNPDIDEKPPMPLRDALEKVKPFLMAYEGIQSQEEWEEIIEDLMKRLPVFKDLIDYYCGPDRVTAKQQQGELQRVAKTLPESAPASVKRFTERAVLSLQSNPGWGWDKKCQFVDKLVWEVSQHYK